jgi:hypothetical protein
MAQRTLVHIHQQLETKQVVQEITHFHPVINQAPQAKVLRL